jgi:hydroxymethylglutaryl-CoA reductase
MDNDKNSRLVGFYKQSLDERVEQIARWATLTSEETVALRSAMAADRADQMIENVVGLHALPLGIAVNFRVNDRDRLVPMAIEEPSVVAGASFAAKLARARGGFRATTTASEMIGQIQVLDVPDIGSACWLPGRNCYNWQTAVIR